MFEWYSPGILDLAKQGWRVICWSPATSVLAHSDSWIGRMTVDLLDIPPSLRWQLWPEETEQKKDSPLVESESGSKRVLFTKIRLKPLVREIYRVFVTWKFRGWMAWRHSISFGTVVLSAATTTWALHSVPELGSPVVIVERDAQGNTDFQAFVPGKPAPSVADSARSLTLETRSRSMSNNHSKSSNTAGITFEQVNAIVERLEGRLTGELKAVEGRLTGELKAVEGRLTGELKAVEGRLSKEIEKRPTKSQVALVGLGLAGLAWAAGACELHWAEIAKFFHL